MKINWILYTLAPLSVVLVSKWFVELGFRINFFEIFILIFISLCFIFCSSTISWDKKVRLYLLYIWGFFAIAASSIVCILFIGSDQTAYNFYFKGIFQLFIYSIFLTFLVLVLTTTTEEVFNKIVDFYLFGVFLSIGYSFLQIILKIRYRIDIDAVVSDFIPFVNKVNVSRYEYGNFFRINGLAADPNIHASYCLSALPFMIVKYFNKGGKKYILGIGLILLSIILSMSISALIGVFVVFLFVIYFYLPRLKRVIFIVIPILLVLLIFYFLYKTDIDHFAAVKFSSKGTTSYHLSIAINSVKIFFKYPLGAGNNNFSIAYFKMFGIKGWNPHNSWLTYLVEEGVIGFIFKSFLFILFFWMGIKQKNESGRIFAITIAGLSFSALGYESLNLFYSQYWIAILYIALVRDSVSIRSLRLKQSAFS